MDDTVTACAGLDVQRNTSPPSPPLAFYTFRMLLAPITNREPHGVALAGYCYTTRHGMKVNIVTLFRVIQLQSYNATAQVCTHLKLIIHSGISIYRSHNVRFLVFIIHHLCSRIKFHINNVIYFCIHRSPDLSFFRRYCL
jgi:hypothetical protein